MNERPNVAAGRRLAGAAALFALATLIGSDALGEGVVQVQTSKSLPEATVAVIDPESGSSSGTAGQDVNLAVGDIILFRFNFTPVPDATNRGMNGYLTEYVPPNTEVVGMRIVDENGLTVEPRRSGLGINGCSSGGSCNSFTNVPCAGGTCSFAPGNIAAVHADTGVFYTTDALLDPNPVGQFITMNNGIAMTPEPRHISPGLKALLNHSGSTAYAHNAWDWLQIRAFGQQTDVSGSSATGAAPYLYGSPVAGPDTHYGYEATDVDPGAGMTIQLNDQDGPWNRVRYPGSRIGTGGPGASQSTFGRIDIDASDLGWDLTPNSPVDATAMRVALGETRTGERAFAEIALRVTGLPLDPAFGSTGNVDCAEVFGTDVAYRGSNNGDDHPWGFYIASPACVYLRLLFDLNVDRTLSGTGDTLTYTISGSNLSLNTETGAVARMKYDSSRQTFIPASTSPPHSLETVCPDDTSKRCVIWNLGSLAPGEDYELMASFTVGGSGQTSNVVVGQYVSDSLPSPGFENTAVTIVRPIAVPKVSFNTPSQVAPGGISILTGTLANQGTADFSLGSGQSMVFTLPAGWTPNGAWTLGGTGMSCTTGSNVVRCDPPNVSIFAGTGRALNIRANVPPGTPAGLYTIDLSVTGSQSQFGGDFETFYPAIVTIPVGAPRSVAPVLDCPIGSTQTSISGTTVEADGTIIRLYFNLIERASGTSAGGAFDIGGYGASFGELYGGLEVRATAQAPGELESPLSDACFVETVKECSDGFDNDGDGLTDFPADPGCESLIDNDEGDDPSAPECSNGVNDDADGQIDWPADQQCYASYDPTEAGASACADGVDNDGDGFTDGADADCGQTGGQTEHDFKACQDGLDNDGDGAADFPADSGCHSAFDDDEGDEGETSADKARLLIVLDSSGSMNWNTCTDTFTGGDGSLECAGEDVDCSTCNAAGCGNGEADDSRLYRIKAGLTNVVAAFGEIDWGLMRFAQRDQEFQCPGSNASLQSGGWQGGGAAPCGGGFDAGELLVSFSPDNPDTILGWIDGTSNYSGPIPPRELDFEVRGSGTTPLAGSLSSALDYLEEVQQGDATGTCRPYRVVLLTDGAESCGGDPVGAAAALQAAGIPVYVIGFATPDPTIIAQLDAIAAAGGTGAAILADDDVELSAAMADVIQETIMFETCNGLDDDCDGNIDEDFPDLGDECNNGALGECFATGVRECNAAGNATTCVIDDAPQPSPEVCNGLDDNCNGLVDEGLVGCDCTPFPEVCNGADDDCDGSVDEEALSDPPPGCGIDVGECEPGSLACVSGGLVCQGEVGPVAETCDGLDNDCDTQVDELAAPCYGFATGCDLGTGQCVGTCQIGIQTCSTAAGECDGDVGPGTESCNGFDDDCDGNIDEAFPNLGDTCTVGQGACETSGTIVCTPNGAGTQCNAVVVTPGQEVCNGVDDDCDGDVDEELGAPIGNPCGGGQGCTGGTFQCVDGQISCEGSTDGAPEECNGLDDDCDLIIDEDTSTFADCVDPAEQTGCDPACGALEICVDGACVPGDQGECTFGNLQCIAGDETCPDYEGPEPEVCNGADDDCDGEVDDMATCPSPNDICVEGECVFPCGDDEFPCPFGFYCDQIGGGSYCLPDPCVVDDVQCPSGSYCESGTGECIDLCDGVSCRDGEMCQGGQCVDCFDLGCPAGQDCVRNPNGVGECQDDLCHEVSCDDGEFCNPDSGECVAVVCDPACGSGQVCQDGQCVEDPCSGVECTSGRVCNPQTGECVTDMCLGVNCPINQVCQPSSGDCIDDPCDRINCPSGAECKVQFDGSATCVDSKGEYVFAGGSGCGCQAGGQGQTGSLLLAVGAVLFGLRRRRRRG